MATMYVQEIFMSFLYKKRKEEDMEGEICMYIKKDRKNYTSIG